MVRELMDLMGVLVTLDRYEGTDVSLVPSAQQGGKQSSCRLHMFIISWRIQLTHGSQAHALLRNLTCRAFSPAPCIICTNQYSVTRDCRATSTLWSLPFALALCAAARETRLDQSCLSSSPLASFPWHLGYLFHVNIPEHILLPGSAKFAVVLAYQFFT